MNTEDKPAGKDNYVPSLSMTWQRIELKDIVDQATMTFAVGVTETFGLTNQHIVDTFES
jgi:hypothetical protein